MNSLPEAQRGRCPITGLPVTTHPEWTRVSTGPRTAVTVSLIGDSILDIKTFGERTPETQETWEALRQRIHAEVIRPGWNYVELFDVTHLTGIPGSEVRRRHSRFHLSEAYRGCAGCFVYGSNMVLRGIFRTGIALAGGDLRYPFRVVKDYDAAVAAAIRALGEQAASGSAEVPRITNADFFSLPGWTVRSGNGEGEVRIHAGFGRVVLMEFSGVLDDLETVPRVVRILDEVFDKGYVTAEDYLRVTDYGGLESSSMAVRMKYAQELRLHFERHRPSTAKVFVVGAPGWVRAALFFASRITGVLGRLEFHADREGCFAKIGQILFATGKGEESSTPGESEFVTVRRSDILQVTAMLGALAWEQDEPSHTEAFPDRHPLGDLGEAIRLVRSDYRDVLDRHKEAERKALAASQAKSDFLANMSHEIRTPLNGVIGMLQLMLQENLATQEKQYASIALTSANSLLSIVNDILDISKIEAGRIEREDVVFQLRECLGEFAQIARLQAKEKGLVFHAEVDDGVPEQVIGDLVRIRQIMSNLVGNAIKFTSKGEVRAEIRILSRGEKSIRLRFSVEDSGIGIPPEKLEPIFESFNQADTSTTRKYGGTGLGLAISRQLARILGGELQVSSRHGEGSLFWFDLDLGIDVEERIAEGLAERVHCGETSLPTASAPPRKCSFADGGHPPEQAEAAKELRILVVEDNAVNRKVAQGFLNRLGYASGSADNGAIALQKLSEEWFDLVLMDCQMPVMDGFEAARQIRSGAAGERNGSIPIVALTAAAHDSDREMVIQAGMNDYLSKPFTISQMREMVDRWLGANRTSHRRRS